MNRCLGSVVVSSLASKAGRHGNESISGWLIFYNTQSDLGSTQPSGYLGLSAGEVKDVRGVVFATLLTYRMAKSPKLPLHSVNSTKMGDFGFKQ